MMPLFIIFCLIVTGGVLWNINQPSTMDAACQGFVDAHDDIQLRKAHNERVAGYKSPTVPGMRDWMVDVTYEEAIKNAADLDVEPPTWDEIEDEMWMGNVFYCHDHGFYNDAELEYHY